MSLQCLLELERESIVSLFTHYNSHHSKRMTCLCSLSLSLGSLAGMLCWLGSVMAFLLPWRLLSIDQGCIPLREGRMASESKGKSGLFAVQRHLCHDMSPPFLIIPLFRCLPFMFMYVQQVELDISPAIGRLRIQGSELAGPKTLPLKTVPKVQASGFEFSQKKSKINLIRSLALSLFPWFVK